MRRRSGDSGPGRSASARPRRASTRSCASARYRRAGDGADPVRARPRADARTPSSPHRPTPAGTRAARRPRRELPPSALPGAAPSSSPRGSRRSRRRSCGSCLRRTACHQPQGDTGNRSGGATRRRSPRSGATPRHGRTRCRPREIRRPPRPPCPGGSSTPSDPSADRRRPAWTTSPRTAPVRTRSCSARPCRRSAWRSPDGRSRSRGSGRRGPESPG